MTDKPVRPRQVTLSGVLVMVGSVFIVLMAFQQIASLGSLEAQQSASRLVSESPADGLGLSADDIQGVLRVLGLITGATGAATAILGLMVLRRRAGSDRLVLSLLAPVLLICGLSSGGLSVVVVTAAIAFLWTQPARDWFAGREPVRVVAASKVTAPSATTPAEPARVEPIWSGAVATQTPPVRTQQSSAPGPRPAQVLAAGVITWVWCGVTILLTLASVLVFVTAPEAVFEQIHEQNPDLAEQGLTDNALRVTVFVASALIVPWCVAAVVFAVLAVRRVRWGAIALLVTVGAAGLVCAVSVLGSALMILPLAGCLATTWLLTRPRCREWFAATR